MNLLCYQVQESEGQRRRVPGMTCSTASASEELCRECSGRMISEKTKLESVGS